MLPNSPPPMVQIQAWPARALHLPELSGCHGTGHVTQIGQFETLQISDIYKPYGFQDTCSHFAAAQTDPVSFEAKQKQVKPKSNRQENRVLMALFKLLDSARDVLFRFLTFFCHLILRSALALYSSIVLRYNYFS